MPQGNPRPGERYLHFKGNQYQVMAVAHHSETKEKMVVYQALYGDFGVCVRPYDMFVSEVDREKYPETEQKYRFEYVGEISAFSPEVPGECAVFEQGKTDPEEEAAGEVPETARIPEAGIRNPETEDAPANPWLVKFLDADSLDDKYEVLNDMRGDIDDKLIDDLAVSLDVVIPEGKLQDRFMQLKNCIRTRRKYEGSLTRKGGI